ncbi:hypothetical protein ACFXTO_006416 [Malus domestica]
MEEITRVPRVTIGVIIRLLRVMVAVTTRVLRSPLKGNISFLEQFQVVVLKGTEQAATARVLGLEVAVTVVWDVRLMGVSMP